MSIHSSDCAGDPRNPNLYRPNVGIALFSRQGQVFVGRRADAPEGSGWQMPQGGIDNGETVLEAAYRELAEETGVRRTLTDYLGQTEEWLYYDFPEEIKARLGSPYKGQRQRWIALRFTGHSNDIVLDIHDPAEFDDWKWACLAQIPSMAVAFKSAIYETVCSHFARYSAGFEGISDSSGKAMA